MSDNRWVLANTGIKVNAEICPDCFYVHFDGLHHQNCGKCGDPMETPTSKEFKSIEEAKLKTGMEKNFETKDHDTPAYFCCICLKYYCDCCQNTFKKCILTRLNKCIVYFLSCNFFFKESRKIGNRAC